ncbi:hypothetical protein BUALT_Bualt03G0220500 [Buddleja alternifolia]|uniref:F-box domain-containing protein n=1 Tax=Buddleja alternifolia TaxID=168488 RepID=A0AAV6XXI7_9LAMI|nr:hypothetical protein BUALT_Bualt03G0220500 [Buddleja alternifolia]
MNPPEDAIVEILSRLHVISLIRFKCVCKSWNALLKNPIFIAKHYQTFSLKEGSELLLVSRRDDISNRRVISLLRNGENNAFVDQDLPPLFLNNMYVRLIGPCNGIICLYGSPVNIALWNPSICDFKILPPPLVSRPLDAKIYGADIGIGYDSKTRDLKLKELVSLIVYHLRGIDKVFDIWVINELSGNVESWTKIFSIGPLPKVERPLGFWNNDEFILQSSYGELVLYNCTNQGIKNLRVYCKRNRRDNITNRRVISLLRNDGNNSFVDQDLPPLFLNDMFGHVRLIGPCNGIICLYGFPENIALWNPSTRDFKILPPSLVSRPLDAKIRGADIGIGYDSKTRDLKNAANGGGYSGENGGDSIRGGGNSNLGYQIPTKVARVEFPRFNGDYLRGWLYKCEQFFEVDETPPTAKVKMASVHLEGKIIQWHQMYMKGRLTREIPNSEEYIRALNDRFGALVYDDPMSELVNLKQMGSIQQYLDRFDEIVNCLDLPDPYALSCFLGDLRSEISVNVRMFRPKSLQEAISLAKLQEQALSLSYKKPSPFLSKPSPYSQKFPLNNPFPKPNISPILPKPPTNSQNFSKPHS